MFFNCKLQAIIITKVYINCIKTAGGRYVYMRGREGNIQREIEIKRHLKNENQRNKEKVVEKKQRKRKKEKKKQREKYRERKYREKNRFEDLLIKVLIKLYHATTRAKLY